MPLGDIIVVFVIAGLVWLIWASRRSKRRGVDTTGDAPYSLFWLDKKSSGSDDGGDTGGGGGD